MPKDPAMATPEIRNRYGSLLLHSGFVHGKAPSRSDPENDHTKEVGVPSNSNPVISAEEPTEIGPHVKRRRVLSQSGHGPSRFGQRPSSFNQREGPSPYHQDILDQCIPNQNRVSSDFINRDKLTRGLNSA